MRTREHINIVPGRSTHTQTHDSRGCVVHALTVHGKRVRVGDGDGCRLIGLMHTYVHVLKHTRKQQTHSTLESQAPPRWMRQLTAW